MTTKKDETKEQEPGYEEGEHLLTESQGEEEEGDN